MINALPQLKAVSTMSNIMYIQPFSMGVDLPKIECLMEVSAVLYYTNTQILHGQEGNSANCFPEVLGMSLSPRSRRLRGDRLIPSTEGKQFALFPDWNHVVFVLLHRTVTRGMRP